MAGYSLQGSYSTVQVLSPTLTNPVVYCTIQTTPSGVIASIPVQRAVFESDSAGVELENLATAIEQTMNLASVIAGVGSQRIDPNGLLADFVTFTVQYPAGATDGSANTAEADVPVGMLNFTDALIGEVSWENVQAIIGGVYNNLKSAAGG